MQWPDALPVPDVSPYNWDVGLGVTNSKMNAGNRILRRRFRHLPHQFSFSFSMNTNQMIQFSAFADEVGSDWFNIPGLAMWTGRSNDFIGLIPVRFISNINISANGFNWWSVSFAAEISPDVFWNTMAGPWIDAGYAFNPSPDWIDSGSPQAPSPTWIDGGLATRPSSGSVVTA